MYGIYHQYQYINQNDDDDDDVNSSLEQLRWLEILIIVFSNNI